MIANYMKINTVTVTDSVYPKRLIFTLRERLNMSVPAAFYYCGSLALLNTPCFAFAGSRALPQDGIEFTNSIAAKLVGLGFTIVSGGAIGTDYYARSTALENDGNVIEFVPDTLFERSERKANQLPLSEGRLLMLSAENPHAKFRAKAALGRNKYIYAQSQGAVISRCDFQKGGSWQGGKLCADTKICPVYVYDNPRYEGNQGLISLGATPISAEYDFKVSL
jgi:predicted Rossmann fold nucleotide-binding protein DprA/Smf involved in DNA uptake